MKVKANKRGFTLVELVVVIAILAIIAAIAIPCLINILDSTTASSGEAQAQTLNQVCQNAYNEIKAVQLITQCRRMLTEQQFLLPQ